jgi:hypothetical protein
VKKTKQKRFQLIIKKTIERVRPQRNPLLLIGLSIDSRVPTWCENLTVKFTKIWDMPTHGICNQIEDARIRFLINPVANGTKHHISKPSFDTLPYSSSGFVQRIGGGWLRCMCCSIPNLGHGVATGTRGCERWHIASQTGYGRCRRDSRDGYGLQCVKCHGSVVSRRCLSAKVVQQHVIRWLCHRCARCSR